MGINSEIHFIVTPFTYDDNSKVNLQEKLFTAPLKTKKTSPEFFRVLNKCV